MIDLSLFSSSKIQQLLLDMLFCLQCIMQQLVSVLYHYFSPKWLGPFFHLHMQKQETNYALRSSCLYIYTHIGVLIYIFNRIFDSDSTRMLSGSGNWTSWRSKSKCNSSITFTAMKRNRFLTHHLRRSTHVTYRHSISSSSRK